MKLVTKKTDINMVVRNISCSVVDNKVVVSVENAALDAITAIKLCLKGFNAFDDAIRVDGNEEFTVVIQDINLYPNKKMDLYSELPLSDIKKLSIQKVYFIFSDGRKEENTPFETEYEINLLEDVDTPEDTITEKEQLVFLQKKNKKFICYPEKHKLGWVCACGTLNNNKNVKCFECGIEKSVIDTYTKERIIEEIQKEKAEKEKQNLLIEKQRLENERKLQEKRIKEQEERDRAVEESVKRMKAEEEKRKKRKLLIITGIVLCVIIVSILLIIKNKKEKERQAEAQARFETQIAKDAPLLEGKYVYEYSLGETQIYTFDNKGNVTTDAYSDNLGQVSGKLTALRDDGSYVIELKCEKRDDWSVKNYLFVENISDDEKWIRITNYEKTPKSDANIYYLVGSSAADNAHQKYVKDAENEKKAQQEKEEREREYESYKNETRETALKISYSHSKSNGYVKVKVTIKNEGKHTYKFEKLRIAWYDGDEVIDTDWTYGIGAEGLQPGESTTASFSIRNSSVTAYKVTWMD